MIETFEDRLSYNLLRELKNFGKRVNHYGFNFAAFDKLGKRIVLAESGKFKSNEQKLKVLGDKIFSQQEDFLHDDEQRIFAAKLKAKDGSSNYTAIIDTGYHQISDLEFLKELLLIFSEKFQNEAKAENHLEKVSSELSHTYEELVLLHKIGTNMKVTESDANFLQMACDNLTGIVDVEGIVILMEKNIEGEKRLTLAAGSGIIDLDESMSYKISSRLIRELNNNKEALIDSEVDTPFKYQWPENIRSLIAVPLFAKEKSKQEFIDGSNLLGIMVAFNRVDKPDFDSTDIKLFNSVANGCGVFIENGKLFKDLKELFIGSLKALTSSIDAKDQYTRGHSERVAYISQWIAQKYSQIQPLSEEQIHKIYLAGLLHDIGKMGIDESVLKKKGRLTEDEFKHIRMHPTIGAGILNEIRQMSEIVPGVLCHHERVDGKGYPNGLKGDDIPLIGKIICLADCFDAMTSKRIYRDAMTVEVALSEISRGMGTQFDPSVAKVFLESDVYELWDVIQDGFCDNLSYMSFQEYGTAAVGTLLR